MKELTLIATCAMGIESLVADEVRALGYECQVENGKITFQGDILALCRASMWLRTAERIKIKIGEFKALSFDELFEKTKALRWADYIPINGEFPVSGKSLKSKLYSVPDCQAIVKKAIVEKLKESYHIQWFQEDGPFFKVEVAIHKDIATLLIDATGAMHKRGYRVDQGEAPLRETLAATLVKLTNWKPNRPFIDPLCGSGTIPIEAALIGQNIAPGFNREFASERWSWVSSDIWSRVREEADDLANYDTPLDISGYDIDHKMIEISTANALEAGCSEIHFKQMQIKDFTTKKEYGVIVGNPPYGERIGEQEEVQRMYSDMGKVFSNFPTWSVYILTSDKEFEHLYGKEATKRRKLFNGFIETQYYQFFGLRPPKQ